MNERAQAIIAELRRIMENNSEPFVLSMTQYEREKTSGPFGRTVIKEMGYAPDKHGWAAFVHDHMGREVMPHYWRQRRPKTSEAKARQQIPDIIKDIQRIADELTAPYAPTLATYTKRRNRMLSTPATILRNVGYVADKHGWAAFVRDNLGLDIEPPEVMQKRKEKAIKNAHDSNTGITDRWTTGVHQRGDLDTLPSEGMAVSSVKTDNNGLHWCMLR